MIYKNHDVFLIFSYLEESNISYISFIVYKTMRDKHLTLSNTCKKIVNSWAQTQ